MSGVTGADRIKRKHVGLATRYFIRKVLRKFPAYERAIYSGSYNAKEKDDFGDIDLIVQFEGEDKKTLKKELVKFFAGFSDDLIVPFKSDKYMGRKSYNSGEIVTVMCPQPQGHVQIDVIVALNEQEAKFKKHFLDLPAEKQGLILGLVKTVMIEENIGAVLKRMRMPYLRLNDNQEYEFNLSSTALTLRIVTLTEDFKELKRVVLASSTDWDEVELLLQQYDLFQSFEELVVDVKFKLQNWDRSPKRIAGIFKSMITVKSGEIGTEKGINKTKALQVIEKTFLSAR